MQARSLAPVAAARRCGKCETRLTLREATRLIGRTLLHAALAPLTHPLELARCHEPPTTRSRIDPAAFAALVWRLVARRGRATDATSARRPDPARVALDPQGRRRKPRRHVRTARPRPRQAARQPGRRQRQRDRPPGPVGRRDHGRGGAGDQGRRDKLDRGFVRCVQRPLSNRGVKARRADPPPPPAAHVLASTGELYLQFTKLAASYHDQLSATYLDTLERRTDDFKDFDKTVKEADKKRSLLEAIMVKVRRTLAPLHRLTRSIR